VRVWGREKKAFEGIDPAEMQEEEPLEVNGTDAFGHAVGEGGKLQGE
jgi:hypothetical protein